MNEVSINYHDALDRVEAQMHEIGLVEFETSGFFCGGMYVRTVFVPKGSYLTSLVHKTDHPFVLSSGILVIYTEDGEQRIEAPHIDITLIGTRRFAFAETDVLFTTIHRTDHTNETDVEAEVVYRRENKYLKEIHA